MPNWTLYEGDCLEVMRQLPAESVDAVITDPPYGIGKAKCDRYFPRDWYYEALRVAKKDAVFVIITSPGEPMRAAIELLGDSYRTTMAGWLSNGMTRGPISFGNWIAVSVGGKNIKWRAMQDVIRVVIRPSEKVDHPSPKPPGLMLEVVRRLTEPGWTILDPFAGSGTTLWAAVKEGRNAIGIEREPAYCEIIRKRMAEVQPALPLVR